MNATVIREDFSKLLSHACRFVSSRSQLPILSTIKIDVQKTSVVLQATNLEMSMSVSLGASVKEGGQIAVSARLLADIIQNLKAEKVNISSDGETLLLESENFKANVAGMNTSDFPVIPSSAEAKVKIANTELSAALAKVLHSTSSDDTRPALAGVLFLFGADTLSLVSTDGFRLSRKNIKTRSSIQKKIIIPKNILLELQKMSLLFSDIGVQADDNGSQVLFVLGDMVLSSRVVEGEYPDFEKIIPASFSISAQMDKGDLLSAIKTAAVFARDGTNTVKIKTREDGLLVSAQGASSGGQESLVQAKVEGPEIEVGYNFRYLEDFLTTVKGESVAIKLNSPISPGLFLDISDEDCLHLIMPVRA